jgi:hypothetical protein
VFHHTNPPTLRAMAILLLSRNIDKGHCFNPGNKLGNIRVKKQSQSRFGLRVPRMLRHLRKATTGKPHPIRVMMCTIANPIQEYPNHQGQEAHRPGMFFMTRRLSSRHRASTSTFFRRLALQDAESPSKSSSNTRSWSHYSRASPTGSTSACSQRGWTRGLHYVDEDDHRQIISLGVGPDLVMVTCAIRDRDSKEEWLRTPSGRTNFTRSR